jgi:hypothetical protein
MLKGHFGYKAWLTFFFVVFLFSCRKEQAGVSIPPEIIAERFFNEHRTNSTEEKQLIDYLSRLNAKKGFITKTVERIGFPRWDKLVKCSFLSNSSGRVATNSTVSTGGQDSATNYIIPFVRDTENHVNAAMFIKTDKGDTTISYLCDWQYTKYRTATSTALAEDMAVFFMFLDRQVNGYDEFEIIDTTIFRVRNYKAHLVRLGNIDSSSVRKDYYWSFETLCQGIWDFYISYCWKPLGDCNPEKGYTGGQCDHLTGCPLCQSLTVTPVYSQRCFAAMLPGSPPSGGVLPSPGNGFGNNQGGSGNNDGPAPPSNDDGLKPGWKGSLESPYIKYRIEDLKNRIAQNPFELFDCNTVSNLNIGDGSGPIFPRIAKFQVPNQIVERINFIRSVSANWFVDNFNIQSLAKGYGTVVNCDYFPIRIKKLPLGISPKDLLESFRKNINSFISSDIDVKFMPYKDNYFDDSNQFNKDFKDCEGSLIHIDMMNDGSVIISDYQNSKLPNAERHYFKFTTMETPLDFEHPVAGHREFGIFEDPRATGEYIFYTSAVDRTHDYIFEYGNRPLRGFENADKLWSNIQLNFANFINKGFGVAEFNPSEIIIQRPNWEIVKEYLQGKITYEQLKKKLGC